MEHFPKEMAADGTVVTAQPLLDDSNTHDFLIKAVPNTWFDQLTNDG